MGRGRAAVGSAAWLPLAVLAGCVAVFVALSLDVTHGGAAARLDLRVAPWMAQHVTGDLHAWAWRLTHLGDWQLLAVAVAAAAAVLVRRGRRLDAVLLVAAGASAALVTSIAKDGFHRARPPFVDATHRVHSFSYPSGHSSGAFAVYVLAAVLLTRGTSARIRVAALAGALGLATLVGATRVVLPVHYLSDVVAGAAVGIALATAACYLAIGVRRAASGTAASDPHATRRDL
jgi:membrane-associated phospholipid phosphatase